MCINIGSPLTFWYTHDLYRYKVYCIKIPVRNFLHKKGKYAILYLWESVILQGILQPYDNLFCGRSVGSRLGNYIIPPV